MFNLSEYGKKESQHVRFILFLESAWTNKNLTQLALDGTQL
ncbi:hypothetical protein [Buttiauxella noackiae]|uniref:Uncharacterized protein n=1 Tax=Buttiauxella noackiae ATCC 51607 TaxID=1354255 RepID=A0A1B7HV11_9ENTR|nr:hypothetical protein M979_1380 [Buttiauxella noackiae ATCC 51607]